MLRRVGGGFKGKMGRVVPSFSGWGAGLNTSGVASSRPVHGPLPAAGGCRPGILCRAGDSGENPRFSLLSQARLSGLPGKDREDGVAGPRPGPGRPSLHPAGAGRRPMNGPPTAPCRDWGRVRKMGRTRPTGAWNGAVRRRPPVVAEARALRPYWWVLHRSMTHSAISAATLLCVHGLYSARARMMTDQASHLPLRAFGWR
jgi:hypothetical protein